MFTHLFKHFESYPLNKKIFGIVLFSNFLILTALLIGFFLLTRANNQLIYQTTADSLSASSVKLYDKLTNIEAMSATVAVDKNLQNLLSSVKSGSAGHDTLPAVYNRLEAYYQQFQYNHISYMMLKSDSFQANTYIADSQLLPETVIEELIQNAKNQYGKAVWVTAYSRQYGLFLVREIRRIENAQMDTLGTLIIHIDTKSLISDSSYYSSQYSDSTFLLCGSSSLIETNSDLSSEDLELLQKNFSPPYAIMKLRADKFFIVQNQIPDFQWDFYSLVPYSSVYKSVRTAQFIFLCALLLSLAGAFLFARYSIGSLTIHFDNLIKKIKTFQTSTDLLKKYKSPYDYSQRMDELGIIHQQFDAMALRIDELINVNYKNELLVKEAQIKALETQINPHFLYNTLESINWRAKISNEQEISLMVESLGNLMRASLSQKTKTFSIRQELDFLNSYIAIQQLRFEEQLRFTMQADEEIMDIQVPKLTIQPLVENAIHYALEEMTEECRICVILSHDTSQIYIRVKNSGSKLEENLLNKLYDRRVKPNGFGVGLMNIDQRLKLRFGPEYGLTLFNEDFYAVVQVTIPYGNKGDKTYAETDYCRR